MQAAARVRSAPGDSPCRPAVHLLSRLVGFPRRPPLFPSAVTPPQAVELKATKVLHVGVSDAASYPIAKKKTSYEFLREKMHLRPRTNTIGAVARIRNALAFATHRFFQVRSGAAGI